MIQAPLFDPPSDWRPPDPATLPAWRGAKRVAVDLETYDPTLTTLGPGVRRGGYVVGIAFAIEGGPAAYLPVAHAGGDNMDPVVVWRYLRDQAREFRGEICGANLSYDLDYLLENRVEFGPDVRFRDVQVAEPLLDENQFKYSLESIAQRRGFEGKAEAGLREAARRWGLHPKQELWKLPARHVAPYALGDVDLPLKILAQQEAEIDASGLRAVYDLESDILPILIRIRRRGIRVNFRKLEEIENWTVTETAAALARVRALTGHALAPSDLWTAEPIAAALESLGFTLPATPTGQKKLSADVTSGIDHDAARAISRARKLDKIRTTFAASVRAYATHGRIHCLLHQLKNQPDGRDPVGVAFGRFSSTNPNMQQQPARDPELGPMWRSIYLPEDGEQWVSMDYSQQEPRWIVHYAALVGCQGAAEAASWYRENPTADCYVPVAQSAGIPRAQAKIIFLGVSYGMGGGKLCRSLKLPTKWIESSRLGKVIEVAGEEGQAILDAFHARVPYVKQLRYKVEQAAGERGFIRTYSGRRCRFPRKGNGQYDYIHKALNRVIQGSSADQTKTAMLAIERAGIPLTLQIHDEITMSTKNPEHIREAKRIMETCIPMKVPALAVPKIGPSWGEAKEQK